MRKYNYQINTLTTRLFLALLLIIAAILRIVSCNKYIFIDESAVLGNVFYFFQHCTFLPKHFNYPTLFSYFSAVSTAMGVLFLYIQGTLPYCKDIVYLFKLDSTLSVFPARLASVFFGLFTILLVFEIGKRFFNKNVGIIAAAILCFSELHISYSSYALPDATVAFFSSCSLLFVFFSLRTKATKDFILAGFFAGLATSTKYNGIFSLLPILTVHFVHLYDEKNIFSVKHWINKNIILSMFAFVGAFILGSPGWLFTPILFLNSVIYEYRHMKIIGHLGCFGLPYITHLMLFWESGRIIAILFGLGVFYAIFRHKRNDFILLLLVLSAFFYIGSWQKKNLYYLLFIYPALALLAANMANKIFIMIKNWLIRFVSFSPLPRLITKTVIFSLILLWAICFTAKFRLAQLRQDSRWTAYNWIQKNIPEGEKIVVDWAYLPLLLTKEERNEIKTKSPKFYDKYLKNMRTYELVKLKYNSFWLLRSEGRYLVTSSQCFERFFNTPVPPNENFLRDRHNKRKETYEALFYKTKELGWKQVKKFYTGQGPHILIYSKLKRNVEMETIVP